VQEIGEIDYLCLTKYYLTMGLGTAISLVILLGVVLVVTLVVYDRFEDLKIALFCGIVTSLFSFTVAYIYIFAPQQLKHKASKMYIELLKENREKLLEYEFAGYITGSDGYNYCLYKKDNQYYIAELQNTHVRLNLLSDYVYLLEKNSQDILEISEDRKLTSGTYKMDDNQRWRYDNKSKFDDYILLTPCNHDDYNYCFYNGSSIIYFEISDDNVLYL
jgi:hypothetical protein